MGEKWVGRVRCSSLFLCVAFELIFCNEVNGIDTIFKFICPSTSPVGGGVEIGEVRRFFESLNRTQNNRDENQPPKNFW